MLKSVVDFLFNFKSLRWGQRLSRQQFLYQQGRLVVAISPFVAVSIGLLLGPVVWFRLYARPQGVDYPTTVLFVAEFAGLIIAACAVLYYGYQTIKTMAMRLHDLNHSAVWLLLIPALIVIDNALIESFLPGFTAFLSLVSLCYLALLIWPGQPLPNLFGVANAHPVPAHHLAQLMCALPLLVWVVNRLVHLFTFTVYTSTSMVTYY